jgi:hypothetical protein
MLKEEWRSHSAFFGGFMFALFPIMITASCLIGTLFIRQITWIAPADEVLLILTYLFVMFGLSAGSFGLLGREAMNRRFGQASLIAYSSRTLPVSEKLIFLTYILKEFTYYLIYWILPFPAGFLLGAFFMHIPAITAYYLLASFTVSFLMGLSFSFLLSTIFVNIGKKLFSLIVFLLLAAFIVFNRYLSLIPTYTFLLSRDHSLLAMPVIVSILLSGISIFFLKLEFPVEKKPHAEMLSRLAKLPGFSVISSKDTIDLFRSEGGIGKILFSLLLPSLALWKIIEIFTTQVAQIDFLAMYTICFAMLTSNIYNWLTEYDSYGNYSFLPVLQSDLIKSKFRTFIYINIVSLLFVTGVASMHGDLGNLTSAFLCILGLSVWTCSTTIYLTGLLPNVSLYNPKIFALYIFFNLPVTLAFLVVTVFNPQDIWLSVFMIVPALFLVNASLGKWDRKEQVTY